jgi:hypothetical protein
MSGKHAHSPESPVLVKAVTAVGFDLLTIRTEFEPGSINHAPALALREGETYARQP